MRTFIAVDLSPEIKSRLAELVGRLVPLGGDVKWVTRESMHLTLKFLGEIDEMKEAQVEDLLEGISARQAAFPLACRGTGSFPPGSRSPRVLWVGVQAGPALASLQEEIESGGERLGFERESRPFHPHLTLGRVKSSSGIARVLREFEEAKGTSFGEMTVRSVVFFQSRLRPSGAEYKVLREFPLK